MGTGSRTALIVEDDRALLGLLCEALMDAGFMTSGYAIGRPASEALARQRFDLAVLDVNLPDMNGLTLFIEAREQYGEDTVIVVITGMDIQRRALASFQLGADAFLGKPFNLDELLARIAA